MATARAEWLRLLKDEYFSKYIPQGGATVKVAVTDPESTIPLLAEIEDMASDSGMLHFHIMASQTRVDLIHEIFFAVSHQIDWIQWADAHVRKLLIEHGKRIADDTPLSQVESIAKQNGITTGELRSFAGNLIRNDISKDYSLAKDFRIGFSTLCAGRLSPTLHSEDDCTTICKWFAGEKCDLKSLKKLEIFQKVARHNARWMLNSLTRLSKKLGNQGVLITIDIQELFGGDDLETSNFKYAKTKIMDFYEVLRQFIDDIDNASHLALIVITPRSFVEDPKNAYKIYHALHTRLVDDVRDMERSNPLNALTVLSNRAEI